MQIAPRSALTGPSRLAALGCLAALPFLAPSQEPERPPSPPIQHRIDTNAAGERLLVETVLIDAPLAEVWKAYTTPAILQAWMAPVVDIDLRAGGQIRSHYNPDAELGDPGTNVLHIVNWVPERVLTLKAEIGENWPELLERDAENLMNVVLFEAVGDERTRIESYGLGYGDDEEYDTLLNFFAQANRGLYQKLKAVVEAPAE